MGRAERVERGPWGGGLVAKGLMVCWWQVSFKEPRQGGLCQKDVGCRGWGGFSKGAAGGWQYVWTGPGRQGVGNMSHSELRVSLPFWFSDYIRDQKVCMVYCLPTQPAICLDTQPLILFSDIFEITVHLISKHLDKYTDN